MSARKMRCAHSAPMCADCKALLDSWNSPSTPQPIEELERKVNSYVQYLYGCDNQDPEAVKQQVAQYTDALMSLFHKALEAQHEATKRSALGAVDKIRPFKSDDGRAFIPMGELTRAIAKLPSPPIKEETEHE